jgi:hypothetical protein
MDSSLVRAGREAVLRQAGEMGLLSRVGGACCHHSKLSVRQWQTVAPNLQK